MLKLLKPADGGGFTPIVEDVRIASGYEEAVAAALGDDLDAASDEAAPVHWRVTASGGEDPDASGRGHASQSVRHRAAGARAALESRSASSTAAWARRCSRGCKPGQRLVSREGDLWRWDGYSLASGSATAAAARLVERSRLEALKTEANAAASRLQAAEADAAGARAEAETATERTKALRHKVREARDELGRTRDAIAAAEHEGLVHSKQLGALAEANSRTIAGLDEAREALARTLSAGLELAALNALEESLERARGDATESRSAHARAEAALQGFEREVRLRQERLEAIGAEEELWQTRIAKAREQIETLRARETETRNDLAALANLPAEIEARRGRLLDAVAAAEQERSKAADDLARAETELKARDKALARSPGAVVGGAGDARPYRGEARRRARAAERDGSRHPRAARLRP